MFGCFKPAEYGGVGCVIQKIEKDIYISDLNNSGPAKAAGIQVGDIIKKVDDTSIDDFSISDVSSLLKGTPDSEVKVVVERGGKEEVFTFNRENITSKAVPFCSMREDGIGYVYLDGFTAKASSEVRNAFGKSQKTRSKRYHSRPARQWWWIAHGGREDCQLFQRHQGYYREHTWSRRRDSGRIP